ncbi:MAG: TetR family transcriptional regulator [Phycisphaerae bacterium]|nr:MAG: TetR family transcriptional regulator [Phycisphaerae bacterium]
MQRAVEVFWEKGYQATSIEDLTERMGIGRQSLYNTFGDKESLMTEAIDAYFRVASVPMLEVLQAPGSPVENIKRFFQKVAEYCASGEHKGCLMVNTAVEISGADRDSPILKAIRNGFQSLERAIRENIREGIDNGELNKKTDPLQMATFLVGVFQGILLMSKSRASRATLQRVADGAIASLNA